MFLSVSGMEWLECFCIYRIQIVSPKLLSTFSHDNFTWRLNQQSLSFIQSIHKKYRMIPWLKSVKVSKGPIWHIWYLTVFFMHLLLLSTRTVDRIKIIWYCLLLLINLHSLILVIRLHCHPLVALKDLFIFLILSRRQPPNARFTCFTDGITFAFLTDVLLNECHSNKVQSQFQRIVLLLLLLLFWAIDLNRLVIW